MAIDGLVRDVEALIAREPFQILSGLLPREVGTDALVVMEIRNSLPFPARFDDRGPRHGAVPLSRGSARHRPLRLKQKKRILLANPYGLAMIWSQTFILAVAEVTRLL